jgi:hypothetical protein
MWPHLGHKIDPSSFTLAGVIETRATESAGLMRFTANSIPHRLYQTPHTCAIFALLEACVPFARKLLRAADKSESGYSWKSSGMPGSRNLTGFSHGAVGIGHALLELFHSTRDLKYRRAAEAAFRYERHWYDPYMRNWPDLREEPRQPRPSRPPFPFWHCLVPRGTRHHFV